MTTSCLFLSINGASSNQRVCHVIIIFTINTCTSDGRYVCILVDDVRENALDSEGLDLIVVPGLAFTEVLAPEIR